MTLGDDTASARGMLTTDERAELERLRAEVATLRAATVGEPPATEPPPAEAGPRREHNGWRWVAVGVLLVLAGVFTFASVTTRFVRSEILDTDHYVATVTPIGNDPAVRAQIVDTITDEINSRVDVEALTTQALTALTELTPADRPRLDQAVIGLAPVIAGQAESFVHNTVSQFVDSAQFQDLWVAANRTAHTAVVGVVTGETNHQAVVVDPNGSISIALGPIIDQVKQRLTDRGFAFVDKVPTVDKQFVIFQSPDLVRAQRLVNTLDRVATVLPWLALAAGAGAIAAAPRGRRMRAVMLWGVTIVVAMLVLAIGILVGRAVYLSQVPPSVISAGAATAVFDAVATPLRTALRAVAVLGLVIAVVGFLTGGSRSAGYVRHGIGSGFDALQNRRKTRPPNSVERWVYAARIPLRTAIVAIGAVLLMFWRYPTGAVVAWTVVCVVVALVVLEVLIRPARQNPGDDDPDAATGESAVTDEVTVGERT